MTDYVVGSLSQSLLNGDNVLDKDLDDIFKKSAGPVKFPEIVVPSARTQQKFDQGDINPKKPLKSSNLPQRNKLSLEENYAAAKLRQAMMKSRTMEKLLTSAGQKHTKTTKRKAEDTINLTSKKKRVRKQEYHDEVEEERKKDNEIEESDDSVLQGPYENEIRSSDVWINKNMTGTKLNVNDKEETNVKLAPKVLISRDDEEKQKLERTIFVGNLPVAVISKAGFKSLSSKFKEFGNIQSIRFRSIAFSELLPRKAAFVTGKLHPDRDVVNAYIVYMNKGDAAKAIHRMNAKEFLEKHVRVDWATNSKNHDQERSIFVGNLAFEAQEEDLWKFFDSCGKIENVRVVRDSKTNVGKGFAYVQFQDRASINLALKLNGIKLGTRKLRVQYCTVSRSDDASKDNKITRDAGTVSAIVNQRSKLKKSAVDMSNASNAKRRLLKKKTFKTHAPTAEFEGIRATRSSVRLGRSEKREKKFKKHSAGAKSHKKKDTKS